MKMLLLNFGDQCNKQPNVPSLPELFLTYTRNTYERNVGIDFQWLSMNSALDVSGINGWGI